MWGSFVKIIGIGFDTHSRIKSVNNQGCILTHSIIVSESTLDYSTRIAVTE